MLASIHHFYAIKGFQMKNEAVSGGPLMMKSLDGGRRVMKRGFEPALDLVPTLKALIFLALIEAKGTPDLRGFRKDISGQKKSSEGLFQCPACEWLCLNWETCSIVAVIGSPCGAFKERAEGR